MSCRDLFRYAQTTQSCWRDRNRGRLILFLADARCGLWPRRLAPFAIFSQRLTATADQGLRLRLCLPTPVRSIPGGRLRRIRHAPLVRVSLGLYKENRSRGEEVRDGGRTYAISFDLMPTAPGILGLDQASEAPLSFPASDSTTSTSTCSI